VIPDDFPSGKRLLGGGDDVWQTPSNLTIQRKRQVPPPPHTHPPTQMSSPPASKGTADWERGALEMQHPTEGLIVNINFLSHTINQHAAVCSFHCSSTSHSKPNIHDHERTASSHPQSRVNLLQTLPLINQTQKAAMLTLNLRHIQIASSPRNSWRSLGAKSETWFYPPFPWAEAKTHSSRQLPQEKLAVAGGGADDGLRGMEHRLIHRPIVAWQLVQHLAGGHLPDIHRPVCTAADDLQAHGCLDITY